MRRRFFRAHRLLTDVTQMLRLTLDPGADPRQASEAVKRRLANAAELPSMSALEDALGEARRNVRAVFRRSYPRPRRAIFCAGRLWTRRGSGGRQQQFLARRVARLRQMHADDRASADSRADAHRAAMQIDQRTRDGEAEPRAFHAIVERAVELFERPAKPRERRRRDAHAGILHIDIEGALNQPRADADATFVGREFDGVAKQDREDLLDRRAVGVDALAGQVSATTTISFSRGDRLDLRDRARDRGVDLEFGSFAAGPGRLRAATCRARRR